MTVQTIHEFSHPEQARVTPDRLSMAFGGIVQGLPVATLLLDSEGQICQSNRAAEEMMAGLVVNGTDRGIGAVLRCAHTAECPDGCGSSASCRGCSLKHVVARTIRTGQTHRQTEAKVVVQRGRKQRDCYLLVSTSVLESPKGKHVLVCLEDITRRTRSALDLRDALQQVELLKQQLQDENLCLRETIKRSHSFEEIVGDTEELKLTLQKVEHVAATDANVLIVGETGTGKELIARAIHYKSPRKDHPFVTVNCAALSGTLIESELFGQVKGAFTGALADKVGRFELAYRGTIFLDEIGEIHPELQAKLLRVLQDGKFERVGSSVTQTVRARVIAATNRNLQKAMEEGTFRSDLYYRLAVFPIEMPPLRARRQDIPMLAWHFMSKKQVHVGKKIESIPKAAMDALIQYNWPGNIRELENVIERAVILSPGPTLQLADVLANPIKRSKIAAPHQDMETVERVHITQVLDDCRWKVNGEDNAADRLGLKPSTLRSRMKKLGIERP